MITLRAPAYPLITSDPYFNVWCMGDNLNQDETRHWTGKPQTIRGSVFIDGTEYLFMGDAKKVELPAMQQIAVHTDAFSTVYEFEAAGIRLKAAFTSPVLPDDLDLISRPVSYLHVSVETMDSKDHEITVQIVASEELCADLKTRKPMQVRTHEIENGIQAISMGTLEQPVLGKSGDDLRIDWGYFYLSVQGGRVYQTRIEEMAAVAAEVPMQIKDGVGRAETLIIFAYDDLFSITYFGEPCSAYWKRNGQTILEAIVAAVQDYPEVKARCDAFSKKLYQDADKVGGEKYADLLLLSMRQVVAAHKLVVDPEGQLLFISKECFSNGCAATVDVSYPSIPMFLIYQPALVYAMMRPIFKYASSELWPHPFAPHDCGTYPILNGQVYSKGTDLKDQMPIEECGNMLVMAAAYTAASNDFSLIREHRALLEQWAGYLVEQGVDPEYQLCTDDFAGHLAHNCNLSLKAIVALGAYAKMCAAYESNEKTAIYRNAAEVNARQWTQLAANGDGSYRLTFDSPGTFSMKYNMVWDTMFDLGLFSDEIRESEVQSYSKHVNPYGLPLDNRNDYTKSDWLVWAASLTQSKESFRELIAPLWLAYHKSPSRVPMTDWYCTVTSQKVGFQNRTVQGGLFIRVLQDRGLFKAD